MNAQRDPCGAYWVPAGTEFIAALRRANEGEDPELLYLEYVANSESEVM